MLRKQGCNHGVCTLTLLAPTEVFATYIAAGLSTHRPLSSSFLGLLYRILMNMNYKKDLLRGLWVDMHP